MTLHVPRDPPFTYGSLSLSEGTHYHQLFQTSAYIHIYLTHFSQYGVSLNKQSVDREDANRELLASHNNADEPSIPSPIAPLLYLSVFRHVAPPILYRKLQLATTSHSLLGGLGEAVSLCALRVKHSSGSPSWPKQRRTALVKELTITRPDRYLSRGPMVSNEGKIVKEEMSHHVQIIRMCPTLTHIGVCYFHVHQAKQRGLLDALEGRKSLRALSVIVESIPIFIKPERTLRLSTDTSNDMQKLAGSSDSLSYGICYLQLRYRQPRCSIVIQSCSSLSLWDTVISEIMAIHSTIVTSMPCLHCICSD